MGSLLAGQGLLRERGSAVLQGWWMVAGGHRIIAGDALNLVVLLSSGTPTHGHTLETYTLIDNRTTIEQLTTAEQPQNTHTRTESVGSTKEPTNFLICTACCCSASSLTFHAFILPYSPSRCMQLTKYFKKLQKQLSKSLLTTAPSIVHQNHQNSVFLLLIGLPKK